MKCEGLIYVNSEGGVGEITAPLTLDGDLLDH